MYTQPCIIKKNTKELRTKLNNIGLKLNHGKAWGKYLCTFYLDREMKYVASPEYDLINNPSREIAYDCGENEALFLALAALQDDTDSDQWFIYKNDKGVEKWFICDYGSIDSYRDEMRESYQGAWLYNSRKATKEEIIKHFS